MFEHKKDLVITRRQFVRRQLRFTAYATGILFFSLGIGVLGYHFFAGLPWVDALLDASMILTGMGPVNELESPGAKIFAAVYALYSGLAFLSVIAVFMAPAVHRFVHILHLNIEDDDVEER